MIVTQAIRQANSNSAQVAALRPLAADVVGIRKRNVRFEHAWAGTGLQESTLGLPFLMLHFNQQGYIDHNLITCRSRTRQGVQIG
jgi:hypothetical protein